MNTQRKILLSLAAAAVMSGLSPLGQAHEHAQHTSTAASAAPAAMPQAQSWTDAEIRRVDVTAAKLTLKHGEIKNLDMPPMTMVFSLKPGAPGAELLPQLKIGERILFQAEMAQGKTLVVGLKRP